MQEVVDLAPSETQEARRSSMIWSWRVRGENERALRAAMKGEKVYGQGAEARSR
jgi:hypothetical protein